MLLSTVVIVPGLRDHVAAHWQTLLAAQLAAEGVPVRMVEPMGREDLACARRVDALEQVVCAVQGPVVLVAHSGGVITVAHWAQQTACQVQGALLAAPPDFEQPMPEGYPTVDQLREGGWLPVPRQALPFRCLAALSTNDPLGRFDRVQALVDDWGCQAINLGDVGHLNPASGYGEWSQALPLIRQLMQAI